MINLTLNCAWNIPAVQSCATLVLRSRPRAGTRLGTRRRARCRTLAGWLWLTTVLFRRWRPRRGLGPVTISILPWRSRAASGLLLGAAPGIPLRLRFGARFSPRHGPWLATRPGTRAVLAAGPWPVKDRHKLFRKALSYILNLTHKRKSLPTVGLSLTHISCLNWY